MGQALVRVVFVSAVVAWSYLAASNMPASVLNFGFFRLSLGYWIFSILYAGWSYYLVSHRDVPPIHFHLKRIAGVLADLSALSAYTAITANSGIVLFPIFLTTIIGYGYRFGLHYLYLAIAVGLGTFSAALAVNPYLRSNLTLVGTYYLGLVLVPLYASSLLKKHQVVLRRLQEVNEARSRFIANMSHELRTPLHAIISLGDVLREDVTLRGVDPSSSKIGMITDSAQHLLALVNRILDIASADAKSFKVESREPIDLYDVLRRVVSICKPGALEKNLKFFIYVDPEVPSYCRASEQHLQEVLVNTVGNAVKYTDKGSVQLKVTRSSKHTGGDACIVEFQIIDTGVGISAQLMPRIFEPFTLGDDSASRKHSGTGLGLTITKQYVEQMGGTVKLTSREGQGTVCAITLPLEELQHFRDSDVSKPLNCLLVSQDYLTDRDVAFFENANCTVQHTNLQKYSSVSALAQYDVVLVDQNIAKVFIKSAASQMTELASTLFVEFHSKDGGSSAPVASEFVSRVRAGAIGDLISIRNLHRALMGKEEESALSDGPVLHLLVADDNPVNLRTAELTLSTAGHYLRLARDGDEALDLLEQGDFDLAILDMHMPGMSGLDVARFYNFLNRENPTPIVLLTADATQDARREAAGAGIRELLTKPMRARELRLAVVKYSRKPEGSVTSSILKQASDTVVHIEEAVVRSNELEELIELGTSINDMTSIVDDFCVDALASVRSALKAASEKRGAAVKEGMHSLKGAAATLGAGVLQKRARRIEQSTNADACRLIADEADELEMLVERTRQAMNRVISDAYRQKRIGA